MATFTSKPVEGQDPWAATDLAWRASVESAVNTVEGTANAALPSSSFDTRLATRVKVDNTVGRTTHVWDSTNNRWQLVYGDTGWRDISGLVDVGAGTIARLHLRREGYKVTLRVGTWQSTATGTSANLFTTNPLTAGFRPTTFENFPAPNQSGSSLGVAKLTAQANGTVAISFGLTNGMTFNIDGTVSWFTNDAWPTSLPGTAVGSIPNA